MLVVHKDPWLGQYKNKFLIDEGLQYISVVFFSFVSKAIIRAINIDFLINMPFLLSVYFTSESYFTQL